MYWNAGPKYLHPLCKTKYNLALMNGHCQSIIFAFHRKSDVTKRSPNTQSTREISK